MAKEKADAGCRPSVSLRNTDVQNSDAFSNRLHPGTEGKSTAVYNEAPLPLLGRAG